MIENLWQEYMEMPPVTRVYTTACFLTTSAIQLDLITPFHLYFNPKLIFEQFQLWRIATSFCFFGTFGFSFLFNMIFTYRYCRMLEESSFRNKTADFVLMFVFGASIMVLMASFVTMVFLGQAFTIMLVYVWSRRNPFVRMNFFGLLNFNAPYLPWVLLAFSVLLGNSALVDFMGIACGHFYFFLEDVFPVQRGGFRILKTPQFLKWLFDTPPAELNYDPLPEDQRPGGYNFGGGGAGTAGGGGGPPASGIGAGGPNEQQQQQSQQQQQQPSSATSPSADPTTGSADHQQRQPTSGQNNRQEGN